MVHKISNALTRVETGGWVFGSLLCCSFYMLTFPIKNLKKSKGTYIKIYNRRQKDANWIVAGRKMLSTLTLQGENGFCIEEGRWHKISHKRKKI